MPFRPFGQVTVVTLEISVQSRSLAIALAIIVSASPAFGGRHTAKVTDKNPINAVFDLQDLSQEQHKKIYRIKCKFKERIKPLKEELSQLRDANAPKKGGTEIGSAIMAGLAAVDIEPDEPKKEQAQKKALSRFDSLRLQIAQEKKKAWQEILDVLTPEQQADLSTILSERQAAKLKNHRHKEGSIGESKIQRPE